MDFAEITKRLDPEYGCLLAKKLSQIGNDESEMGFRNAGSSGEKKAAEFIRQQMERIGLQDVHFDSFEADAWEFRSCGISLNCSGGQQARYPLSAFAGTPGGSLTAEVVDAGSGTFEECQGLNLEGTIAFIRIDMSKDYWVGVPAYQLERMGARAVITVFEGEQFGGDPKALNSADCIARPTIPVLNISREQGKELAELLKKGTVTGSLCAQIRLDKEHGRSQNVVGMIPGICEEEHLALGAHYDGYFHAYQDDALGVGIIMAVAKAIIESGYRPMRTIVIIAHGAEEFGACDSHYDWCIGSWNEVARIRPPWLDKTGLFMNIDAVNPDSEEYLVQSSPELHDFIAGCLTSLESIIREKWPQGHKIGDVNGPWSDDYNYYLEGIPVLICGRGASRWRANHYHTQMDDCQLMDLTLFQKVAQIYLHLLLNYDALPLYPLNLKKLLESFEGTIDLPFIEKYGIDGKELLHWTESACEDGAGASLYYNAGGPEEDRRIAEYNRWLKVSNRLLVRGLRGLAFDDEVIFKHESSQNNLKILEAMEVCLKRNQGSMALETFKCLPGSSVIMEFEYEVYRYWCVEALDTELRNLYWGAGRVQKPPDLLQLYETLLEELKMGKGYEKSLEAIKLMKLSELEKLKKAIEEEAECLRHAADLISP